jgi:ribose transport system permease protein
MERSRDDTTLEPPYAEDVIRPVGRATRAQTSIRLLGRYGTPGVMVLLIILFSALEGSSFFAFQNLTNVLVQSTIGVIIGLGLTFVLIAGEFDLSVGYTASLAGVLVAVNYDGSPARKVGVILGILAIGVLIGVINGLIVTKLGVTALVATLGVGSLLVGINYWISGGAPSTLPARGRDLANVYVYSLGPVAWPILFMFIAVVAMWLLQNRTTLGLEFQAVGGNRTAAVLSGIRVDRVVILSFVISGVMGAAGGILITANVGSGEVAGGNGFLLSSFAACFLGSVALRDGEFHVLGTLLGVLTIAIGTNGLSLFGVNSSVQYLFQGALLIAAVGTNTAARRLAVGRRAT